MSVMGAKRASRTEAAARTARLSKSYRKGSAEVAVLDEIDIEFERGSLTALMGPTGSGKSTLLHCLAGLERPTSGEVWVGETELTDLDDEGLTRLRREHVGFLFQNYSLMPELTVAENIVLPFELAGRVLDHDHVELVVRTMGISHLLFHRPAELTGFQRQRVAAARAFIGDPDMVLADEPTATLDDGATEELLGLLHLGADRLDASVIMATHDPAVGAAADRVLFLEEGRVAADLEERSPRELMLRQSGFRRRLEGRL